MILPGDESKNMERLSNCIIGKSKYRIDSIFKFITSHLSKDPAHTTSGWQSITVSEAKDGGSGEGMILRAWRQIRGVPSFNCHCCSCKGYIGGQKLLAEKERREGK